MFPLLSFEGNPKKQGVEHERAFLNVIFKSSNFANLIHLKIPQQSVHVRCIIPLCSKVIIVFRHNYSIIPNGVGWLSCLSRWKAMRRPDDWGKWQMFPTSFSFHTICLTINAEAGEVVGC